MEEKMKISDRVKNMKYSAVRKLAPLAAEAESKPKVASRPAKKPEMSCPWERPHRWPRHFFVQR